MREEAIVIGAGVTGLAVSLSSQYPAFEALHRPGGICASYYIRPGNPRTHSTGYEDQEAYRFEYGGGHWIFGGDPAVLRFIESLASTQSYTRRSAVYFSKKQLYVPYPLQNHLCYLDKQIAIRALRELESASEPEKKTWAEWLLQSFGKTLYDLFFGPFHDRYTAGLFTKIAPQDGYKSPLNLSLILQGARRETAQAGYNVNFIYPVEGLDAIVERMAAKCEVHYGKRVVRIDVRRKEVFFSDGSNLSCKRLISTLPLNHMLNLTGLGVESKPDPYTSVLVLNIGATRGRACPKEHWLYVPDSVSGFHRVGFYSNVDKSFLPISSRETNDRTSIYVERTYRGGQKPSKAAIEKYSKSVIAELRDWGYIDQPEVIDPTWIDVAYTWSWPASNWRNRAFQVLREHDIFQAGRYGRWLFQGIADSIKDGFSIGTRLAGNE